MNKTQARLNEYEWLSIVPAGGLGTRLKKLTEKRAKPSLPVTFDTHGNIVRMIDVPLRAIEKAGGAALVSRCFARETLDFVESYGHVVTVTSCHDDSPIDTLISHLPLIDNSTAEHVGLIPGDTNITSETLQEMRRMLDETGADAVLLATRYLPGHNIRSINENGMLCRDGEGVERIGDLGVHIFRREWLKERLHECLRRGTDDSKEVWNDIYDVTSPKGRIYLHVPRQDLIDVDMGTPDLLHRTLLRFNSAYQDALGNIVFPGASLHPASRECVAFPGSRSAEPLQRAIIPEDQTVETFEDYLTV
jgi:hypothetical protein